MFIGIVGTRCSGKSTVESYLWQHGFVSLKIRSVSSEHPTGVETIIFDTPAQMLDHVTRNWRSNFVTVDLTRKSLLEPFIKRPFFLLLTLDAPLLLRYRRCCTLPSSRAPSLEDFVLEDDTFVYGGLGDALTGETTTYPRGDLHDIVKSLVNLPVVNDFEEIAQLRNHLDQLNLLNPDRLRPPWDSYFMTLASLASLRSNCMKRRVGAILVRNNRILSTGYNGTPRGLKNCNEGGCARCNGKAASGEALDECLCLHAEENALLEAGRDRVGDSAVLYCNTCPCLRCSVKIVQTGVTEVVYDLNYSMDEAAAEVFKAAGVKLRQHTPR